MNLACLNDCSMENCDIVENMKMANKRVIGLDTQPLFSPGERPD